MWAADDRGELELLRGRYRSFRFVPHTHDAYSLGVITGGALGYDYRHSVFTAPAGTISVIEPGEVHTGFAGVEAGWRYRNFFVGAELMRSIAADVPLGDGLPSFPSPVIVDPPLARELLDLHRAFEIPTERLERDSRLFDALGKLLSRHSTRWSERRVRRDPPAVARARRYLEETAAENVSLNAVAAIAGYSPFHFLRVFRREVGLTPHGFQLKVRIERATRLLDGGTSLVDAALDCGFSDQSHLTRRFKQVMGVTPGQYVRGRKGGPIVEG